MEHERMRKEVEIEVPPEAYERAEREAAEKGGLTENYLLDQVELSIELVRVD